MHPARITKPLMHDEMGAGGVERWAAVRFQFEVEVLACMNRIRLQGIGVVSTASTLLLALLAVSVAAHPEKLSDSDAAKVRAVNEAYAAAWLKNDPEAVLNTLSKDAVLIPQGNRPI